MNSDKTSKLQIHTPEGIEFSLLLAGPVTRFLAWAVDVAGIAAVTMIAGILLNVFKIFSLDLSGALFMVANFVISVGYSIVLEWRWRGQTLGKKLLGLRVMDAEGLRLRSSQIIIRNIMRFLDSLPLFYVVGGLASLFSRRAQRLGDLAANTIVIRIPEIRDPDLSKLMAGKFNSLRVYPHLCARLRQSVSPQEASLALQALLRRDQLNPDARVELFAGMAAHFQLLVLFPEEVTHGIADEQYVRNVVDILFSSRL